ncbi:MAG TPA: hypothetical protein VGG44_01870 [Tepidisphaeraceae bacterium]
MRCVRMPETKSLMSAITGKLSLAALFAAATFAATTFVSPRAASASVVTFAQFEEATGAANSNAFAYLDNGSNSDSQLDSDPTNPGGAIPVTFTYLNQSGLPADLQGLQNAMLTLTSSTIGPVSTLAVFTGQDIDESGSLEDVLTITRDTPAAEGNGARTDLLTMNFTGILFGLSGTATPQLLGNTSGVAASTVLYSSDFFSFTSSTQRDYSLTFSSWLTNSDGNGLEDSATDNYFASATAAGVGTFDSDVVSVTTGIPEPATLAMAAMFAPMLLRRRKRSA